MKNEWCRIVEVDGSQVLFQNIYDSDDDQYKMQMTIQVDDFLEDSGMSEATLSVGKDKDPFRGESFDKFATSEHARKIVKEQILPLLEG